MAGNYPQQPNGPRGPYPQQPGYGMQGGYPQQQPQYGYGPPQGGFRPPMPPKKKSGTGNIVIWVVCSVLTVVFVVGAIMLMINADKKSSGDGEAPRDDMQAFTYMIGGQFEAPGFAGSELSKHMDAATREAIINAQGLVLPKRNPKAESPGDMDRYMTQIARKFNKVEDHHPLLAEMSEQFKELVNRANLANAGTMKDEEVEKMVVDILEFENRLEILKFDGRLDHQLLEQFVKTKLEGWTSEILKYSGGKTNYQIVQAKERLHNKQSPHSDKFKMVWAVKAYVSNRDTYPTFDAFNTPESKEEYELTKDMFPGWVNSFLPRYNEDNKKYLAQIQSEASSKYDDAKRVWETERDGVNKLADAYVKKAGAMLEMVEALVQRAGKADHPGIRKKLDEIRDRIDEAGKARYNN